MMAEWKAGREPAKGPQNGRINALGIDGRTTLHNIPLDAEAIHDRDFAAEKVAYEEAKAAAAKKWQERIWFLIVCKRSIGYLNIY